MKRITIWRFLLADWQLRFLAVLLAAGLWAFVKNEQTTVVMLAVPLEVSSVPQTMRLVRGLPRTVEVRLRVLRDAAPGITPGKVRVVADLSGVRGRRVSVPLTERDVMRPEGATVLGIVPGAVPLELAPIGREED